MRNTVYLLLGSALKQTSNDLKKYMFQFSESNVGTFFHVLNLTDDVVNYIEIKNQKNDEFGNIEYDYRPINIDNDNNIIGYFTEISQNIVSLATSKKYYIDAKIELSVILQLYDSESVNKALHLLELISKDDDLSQMYNIDIIGLYSDLASLFSTEQELLVLNQNVKKYKEEANKSIKAINDYISNNFHRFIVIQNYNNDNYPLNMDSELLVRILGDYAMLCIENYNQIYPGSGEHNREGATAIGLSSYYFDKYYFSNYMTQASIMYAIKKENDPDKVNVDEAVKKSQDILKNNQNIVDDFLNWKDNILLKANITDGSTDDKCNVELSKGFDKKTEEFKKDLLSILNDSGTSLKLKRAAMAELLGKEDKLIIGKALSRNKLTIDDCIATALQKFVDANNEHIKYEKDENGKIKITVNGTLPASDVETGKADLKNEEMRSLREEILESARDIRNSKNEIESLGILNDKDERIQNSIEDNGFHIGDDTYKLLNDVQPESFEEQYEPHDCDHFRKAIDLRNFFTKIKNQGDIGTCTVFTITSIYEYILKKSENKDYDLSEHFIYYNIPDSQDSKREKGTSYNDVIGVFKSIGICKEETCPYSPETVDKKPSDDAYNEAKNHTICKAKGVAINHNDIISALNDGYPIGISLRVFESLCKNGGTVFMPSTDEISSNDPMYHAMVICGYSLDDKIYIVRNSWGDKVGDKGYFYFPFEYIENKELNLSACIVTAINSGEETKGIASANDSTFNNIDSHIRLAVLQKDLQKEETNYENLKNKYKSLRANYETIFKELNKGAIRDSIIDLLKSDKNLQVSDVDKQIQNLTEEKEPIIKQTDNKIIKLFAICSIIGVFSIVLWFLGLHFSLSFKSWIENDLDVCIISLFIMDVIAFIISFYFIKKKGKEELQIKTEEIVRKDKIKSSLAKEINSMDLTYNYLGRFIENFYETDRIINGKYYDIVSFVDNLDKWLEEETNIHSEMHESKSNDIFIPVISNKALDEYFDNNKDAFTKDIHLYQLLDVYDSNDDEALENTKNSIRKIVVSKINNILSEFSMFKHISGQNKYDYLEDKNIGLNKISMLESMSKVFFKLQCNDNSSQYIFLNTDNKSYMNDKLKFSKKTVYCDTSFKYRVIVMQKGDYKIDDFIKIKE